MLQASVHFRLTQPGSASPAPSSPRDSLASFAPSEAASEQTPLQTPQQEAAGAGDGSVTATVQLPLHVWPLKVLCWALGAGVRALAHPASARLCARQWGCARTAADELPLHCGVQVESEGAPLPSPGTSGEVPPPLLNSEDMPIKCWVSRLQPAAPACRSVPAPALPGYLAEQGRQRAGPLLPLLWKCKKGVGVVEARMPCAASALM